MAEISRGERMIRGRRFSHVQVTICVVITAALLAAGGLLLRDRLLGDNLHAVISHEVYRSAQPSSAALERWIRELGLRTVINLRRAAVPGSRLSTQLPKPIRWTCAALSWQAGLCLTARHSSSSYTIPKAGRYLFSVDLLDENVRWFSSLGSDPYVFELLVESPGK